MTEGDPRGLGDVGAVLVLTRLPAIRAGHGVW